MSVQSFVDTIVKETLSRLGDSPDRMTRKSIVGQSGRAHAVEFETAQTTAVWLPQRDVIVFLEKNGPRTRIVNVGETMRARGIAA